MPEQQRPEPRPGTPEDGPTSGRARLRAALVRASRGQLVVAVLVGLLGFAAVTQVRLAHSDDDYAGLREAELVQALNGLQGAAARAERDIAELEATRQRLSSSSQARDAAVEQAQRELAALGVLAGTTAATGPGIRVTVEDPRGELNLNDLLDGVEELRNAGVEAMEINDRVRVIAQTSFETDPAGVRVDGVALEPPYVIDAIGDPATLAGALGFQGGFTDDVELSGARVVVEELDEVEVSVIRSAAAPRYAESVPGQ